MYHLDATLVIVRWDSYNQIESSTMLLEEHHKWNDIMWFWGSSLIFPSNLGILKGILIGMQGHNESWWMGSFVNRAKSGRLRLAINGRLGMGLDQGGPTIVLEPKGM